MPLRLFAVLGLLAATVFILFVLLLATDTALSVWQRLQALPVWLQWAYAILLGLFVAASGWLVWRWFRPRGKSSPETPGPVTAEDLKHDLQRSAADGINVDAAIAELEQASRRKQSGQIDLALFGEVSSGKSSLVNALVPGADALTDIRAGTTRANAQYQWQAPTGDRIIIHDLPGFSDPDEHDQDAMLSEARRAHLVIYLCDGDLSRAQYSELSQLQALGKPVVLALNKIDQYSTAEQHSIIQRIADASGIETSRIAAIQTGGEEAVRVISDDGSEQTAVRHRPPKVEELRRIIQQQLDNNRDLIESLRDSSILLLAADKLADARAQHLLQQADLVVEKYARRAMLGALAAVTPGSDLVIQGVLATKMVQELCSLYDVRTRDVEMDQFLRLAGGKLKRYSAITLAIAGNGLKAFPGIGTVTGGLLHAVAYGMIFDSLGKAAAETLASRGALPVYPALEMFEEQMSEHLQKHLGRFTRLALAEAGRIKHPKKPATPPDPGQ